MDAKVHKYIVARAIEWLPEEAKDFWSADLELMELSATYLDVFAAPDFVTPEKAAIEPDWHELVHINVDGDEYLLHSALDPSRIRATFPKFIKPYLQRIITALNQSDFQKATKLAGCFSHFIGDTGQPAHVVSDREIAELFPYQKERYMIYHPAVESIFGIAEFDYIPRILGTTFSEINWRIIEKFEQLKRTSRAQEIPILIAIYQDDLQDAQEPANKAVQACVEFFSDFLYTLYCYTVETFHESDFEQLSQLNLSTLVPVDTFCDMMYGFSPLIDRHPDFSQKDGFTYPLIPFDLGTGEEVTGIALFSNMAPGFRETREAFVEYSIPVKVYKNFAAIIGLNHLCANGTEGVFEVWLDDTLVYCSEALSDKMPGEEIKIPLNDSSKIRLLARDARDAPCSTEFFYPIWGNAMLQK